MTGPDSARQGIDSAALVQALEDHALGRGKMTATQVRAAEILLRKASQDEPSACTDASPKAGRFAISREPKERTGETPPRTLQ